MTKPITKPLETRARAAWLVYETTGNFADACVAMICMSDVIGGRRTMIPAATLRVIRRLYDAGCLPAEPVEPE